MKPILVLCALLLMAGCKPPIESIKKAQTATIVVSTAHSYPDKIDEKIKTEIKEQLSDKLSQYTKIINKNEATEDTVTIEILFIKPIQAEVPHWSKNLTSDIANNATGRIFDDFYQGFLRLGVTITPEQRTQIEDDPLEWGLFPKTAKRDIIKSLGYTPYLISGKMEISSKNYNYSCGTFFGWNTIKRMKPINPGTQLSNDSAVIKASCAGVVEYLFSNKLK